MCSYCTVTGAESGIGKSSSNPTEIYCNYFRINDLRKAMREFYSPTSYKLNNIWVTRDPFAGWGELRIPKPGENNKKSLHYLSNVMAIFG